MDIMATTTLTVGISVSIICLTSLVGVAILCPHDSPSVGRHTIIPISSVSSIIKLPIKERMFFLPKTTAECMITDCFRPYKFLIYERSHLVRVSSLSRLLSALNLLSE